MDLLKVFALGFILSCISLNPNLSYGQEKTSNEILQDMLYILADSIIPASEMPNAYLASQAIEDIRYIRNLEFFLYSLRISAPEFFESYFSDTNNISRFILDESTKGEIEIPRKLKNNFFKNLFNPINYELFDIFGGEIDDKVFFVFRFAYVKGYIGRNVYVLYLKDSGLKEYTISYLNY